MENESPRFNLSHFNCPLCNEFSHQIWCYYRWGDGFYKEKLKEISGMERSIIRELNRTNIDVLSTAQCQKCMRASVWYNEDMIYPKE